MKHALHLLHGWFCLCVVSLFAAGNLTAAIYTTSSVNATLTVNSSDGGITWTHDIVRTGNSSANVYGVVWLYRVASGSSTSPLAVVFDRGAGGRPFGDVWHAEGSFGTTEGHWYLLAARTQNQDNVIVDGVNYVWFQVSPDEPKKVIVQLVNDDDRTWTMSYEGEMGPRQVVVNAGTTGSMELTEDELPAAARLGKLTTTRRLNELHADDGSWYYAGGAFRDPRDPANDIWVYETGYNWGPVGKADAKDPPNVFTLTIPPNTASNMPANGVQVDNSAWDVPTPTPENPNPQPPTQSDDRHNPNRPAAELAKAVNQYWQQTLDPTTGQPRVDGYFGPVIRDTEPTTSDGAAIVETLSEMQRRAEQMHQLGVLQGEDAAAIARGQTSAKGLAGDATKGMGGEGSAAGVSAGNLFADPPGGLGYTPGGGSEPNFVISLPASFGGASFDLNPFSSDRFAGVASWFRSAVHWLAIVTFGAWVWSELAQWVRGISALPQAKGNALVGGTGAQATALVAAGLMTTAIVVAITAILAWSFGDLTVPSLISTAMGNPVTSMPAGALWMLDQLFPVGTLLVCLVGKLTFNMYAAGLFATCAAVIRFIVP